MGDVRQEWTVADLAKHLQCNKQTIHSWIHSGRLKGYRLGPNGPFRIPAAEVDRIKAEWTYRPNTETAL